MMLTRLVRPELMDRPDVDTAELHRGLEDLRRINRVLGGRATALRLVLDLAGRVPEHPVRILDLGTGGADIPVALVVEARRRGIPLHITATDLHPTTLAFAREATAEIAEITVAAANALALPEADGSYHLVTSFTMLHHFDEARAVRILREMNRVGRYGIIVTDLARSWPALLGARALAATVWRHHPVTRHDGPASVRAAFTPTEMEELARKVGIEAARVRKDPLFRLSMVAEKPGMERRSSGSAWTS